MDAIHALDGSPAIDIKCFIPDKELFDHMSLPVWV